MSDQDKLSKIEKDVSVIRRWWPAVVVIFGICVALIKLTSSAQRTYDNDIAKKEDVASLSKQISDVKIQLSAFSEDFKALKAAHVSDSLERVAIKSDLQKQIRQAKLTIAKISKGQFITEKRVNGKIQLSQTTDN